VREWLQEVLSAYERNETGQLAELLDQAQREAPPAYWAASGMIMSRDGKLQQGMEAFLLALHADPTSAPVLLTEVQTVLSRYLSTRPGTGQPQTRLSRPRASPHLEDQPGWQQITYAYAIAGRGEEAFALVQEQVERRPKDPEVYIFMAKIFGWRALFKEARAALAVALDLAPYHGEALLTRGMLQQELERYSQALADYLSVVLLDATNADAWEGQAEVILLAGWDPQAALSAFEQALALDPRRQLSRQGRARALRALGREAALDPVGVREGGGTYDVIIEAWYRHASGDSGRRCYLCGLPATFATDHYLDMEYVMGLALRQRRAAQQEDAHTLARRLHDAARERAVAEQAAGTHTRYATTWWCQGCMVDLINGQMGQTGPGEMFLLSCETAEAQGEQASAVLYRQRGSLDLNRLLYTREGSVEDFLRSLAQAPDLVLDYTQPLPSTQGASPRPPYSRKGKRRKKRRRGR
jgi:tetratricopeptide (TPR) repeat protein